MAINKKGQNTVVELVYSTWDLCKLYIHFIAWHGNGQLRKWNCMHVWLGMHVLAMQVEIAPASTQLSSSPFRGCLVTLFFLTQERAYISTMSMITIRVRGFRRVGWDTFGQKTSSMFACSYTIVDYKQEQYFSLTPNQPAVNNPRSFTTKRTGWRWKHSPAKSP